MFLYSIIRNKFSLTDRIYKLDLYKIVFSILFGLLGFAGSFLSFGVRFDIIKINFVWSMIFPVCITLAWGKFYGLTSMLFGLSFLYPFFLWKYNGFANIISSVNLILWVLLQGIGAENRRKNKKPYNNPYFVQIVFSILSSFLFLSVAMQLYKLNFFFSLSNTLSSPHYDLAGIVVVKSTICDFLVLSISDTFMLFPFVRTLLRIDRCESGKLNTIIILSVAFSGILLKVFLAAGENFIINRKPFEVHSLLSMDTGRFVIFLTEIILYFIIGGILARLFQKKLEVEKRVTQRKKSKREIIKLNNELEQMVAERTEELQKSISQLEAFTYTVSHEIKGPLRSIEGYCEFIIEDHKPTLSKEVVHMVNMVRKHCIEMISLIEKLLFYSKTSGAVVDSEVINLKDLIETEFEKIMSNITERKVNLCFANELPFILGDRTLMKHAVSNILSNAVKFTKYRSIGSISVGFIHGENESTIFIKDNGAGFDMKYSGKLFCIFERLHSSKEFEGTGVGLAAVQKIIQKHGGRTWMEGKINEGATLFFTLPAESIITEG